MQAAPTDGSIHPLAGIYQTPSQSQSSSGEMKSAAESKPDRSESREGEHSAKPCALVVDDSPDVTEMLAMFLRHAGYEPVLAFSATEALDVARTREFDVIVSDIGMPGMNGYELAIALRRLPCCRTTPMIAVTGFSAYEDRGRALQSGFDEHLTKPINPQTLLELIERLRD